MIFAFHDLYLDNSPWSKLLQLFNPLITHYVYHTHLSYKWMTEVKPYLANKPSEIISNFVEPPQNNILANHTDFKGKRNIVFVGQVSPHKGIDLLVEAFVNIASDYLDIHLHIIGNAHDLDFEKSLLDKIQQKHCEEKVTFWGYRDDARDFLPGAYLNVMPSRPSLFHESFGRVAIESMSCGVPPIVFRSGALQEIVLHDKTGIICEEESALCLIKSISRLLDDQAFRDRIGSQAKMNYYENYAFDSLKAKWFEFLG